jgi:nitroimidazol reductase NimA-like FMN-containing flavoprotein (pyridoxamine 5'-phosphate oxidase superfamily)
MSKMEEKVTSAQAYELDHRTCLSLLTTRRVGRLVFAGEPPVVLVVRFGVSGERLVLDDFEEHLADCADRLVLVEVDGVDEHQHAGWSVMVHGKLEVVTELKPVRGERRLYVAIVDLTGRWVRGASDTPPLDQRSYL